MKWHCYIAFGTNVGVCVILSWAFGENILALGFKGEIVKGFKAIGGVKVILGVKNDFKLYYGA